jgi:hypothetical protein
VSDTRNEFETLLQVYRNTQEETRRYRDLEWRITIWIVTLLAAVATAITHLPAAFLVPTPAVLLPFVFVIGGYGIWHLRYVHKRLTEERERCRQCEILLRLDRPTATWGVALKPENGPVSFWRGWTHLLGWALTMVAATLVVAAMIVSR